ncbi:MAG: SDR family NAD(P)-dependent oxidoreductase [Acidimicrobiales bacterium]
MRDFSGKLAVITGGASGMGRQIARQLAAEGCDVAICDLSDDDMADTTAQIREESAGVEVTSHHCDVGDEEAILRFRDEVVAQHDTDRVHLVFNNAGISGGGSLFEGTRESWDRCFAVCWGGVYWGTRAFLPLLVAADEGHLVNTSSVNGFWASLGPTQPHTAYSAAKFAVKGFTEALVTDLRVHAPHVGVSLVMPGHIGTGIVRSSLRHGENPALTDDVQQLFDAAADAFEQNAPMSAADAATVILDGVRESRWRILVGDDAHALDAAVRADPETAYDLGGIQDIIATIRPTDRD